MINVKKAHGSGDGYYSYFECSKDVRSHLLRYSLFLSEEDVYDKIMNDELFAPSDVWKKWLSGTILGCSNDTLLLKSGHRFVHSSSPFMVESFLDGRFRFFIEKIKKSIQYLWYIYKQDTVDMHIKKFEEIYPDASFPAHHSKFIDIHAFPYLRALEVLKLTRFCELKPRRALEIGAGACVNVALYYDLFKSKFAIVDLPDTIFAGYVFLKTMFPQLKITLPHEVNEESFESSDVVFVLPYQTREFDLGKFDIAFNMSSFQEMEIDVVNNYLSLVSEHLKKSGNLVLCNQRKSRYINGNCFDNYNLDGFENSVLLDPIFQNFGMRQVKGIDQFFYQSQKS